MKATTEPVRCALVGHGMIGSDHARILAAVPEADLQVVCDLDESQADNIPDGVAFTSSLEEVLSNTEIEAIWICTPQHTHRSVAVPALERDLAVFCEKPMAASLEDADAMIAAAERTGGLLAIGHTLRFDPAYIDVAEAAANGELGTPVQLACRWNAPDFEGRIISGRTTVPLEMMIHDLDVLRWIAGDIEEVFAMGTSIEVTGRGPDAVVGTVRFASGAVAALDHSWIMPAATGLISDHRLAVFGTAGVAYVENRETPAQIFAGTPRFINSSYNADAHGIPSGALPSEDRYFLAMVRDSRPWPLSLADARAALVAGLAMDRSVLERRPVRISELT